MFPTSIPQLIELNAQGRSPFEKLTKFYSLDQINQAAKDSENGSTIKPIIRLSGVSAAIFRILGALLGPGAQQ